MPNHVINELVFRNISKAQQDAVLSALCNADGEVDFRVLVPEALNVWRGNASTEHDRAFGRTWYEWNRENWGTKWNAYSHHPIERCEDWLILRFETAWSPPYPWLAAVLNKFGLTFEHNWLDEGSEIGRTGLFRVRDDWGAEWAEADASESLNRHLRKLHWGVEHFDDAEPLQ